MLMCINMSKKYHQEHPTISFRCQNIDEYNRIKEMVKNSGKSESTFIREILLNAEEKESQSYNNGYNQGINKINFSCPICKGDMIIDFITDVEAREKIAKTFMDYAHRECVEKQNKERFNNEKDWTWS